MALCMWNFSSLALVVHHINSFERFKERLCRKEQQCTLHVSDSWTRQVSTFDALEFGHRFQQYHLYTQKIGCAFHLHSFFPF